MKGLRMVTLLLILGALAIPPVAALHVRYLDIAVDRDGSATVTFEYTLPWIEQVFAFLGVVSPDRDFGRILGVASGGEIVALSAGDGMTTFSMRGFANVTGTPPDTTCTTPALNLSWGQAGYEASILAPLLSPDFSPDVTVVRFPDAYSLTFRDELLIPGITHAC
ncbi:MAG TPA: hypothetical protein VKO45_04630 [Methanomicrobiales archaeon]|nr:hypothetical protein [Methanomicrobiales archaeon]